MFRLYGISETSFSGQVDAWENSLTPETRGKAIAELKEGLNGKKDFYTAFDIRTPSGELKSIFAAAKVLRNSEGEPIAMYGINRDISTEIEHLNDVDRSQKRFRSIFEVSPTPKLVFGKTGILDCNPAAVKILCASSKADLLSRHPAEFSPEIQPDGRRSDEKSVERDRLAHENGVHRFDWVHKNLKGVEFPVDVTLAPIDWDGEDALLVLWSDLTEKKAQELKILKTSKLASLGQLSAGIAHEINNPLAIVEGAVRLLPKYLGDPQKLAAKIEVVEKACSRIAKIVNGLKKFSRSDDKRVYELRNLGQIVKEVVFLTDLKSKRHATPVVVECGTDAMVLCDEVEIEQVVVNLINNAIDAVKDKSPKWVKVSVFEDQSGIKLRVTDSGLGISEAAKRRLFEPFFTTKKVGEGTGLGLSISKGILDEHGATIRVVDSVPNTCFEITFSKTKETHHVA